MGGADDLTSAASVALVDVDPNVLDGLLLQPVHGARPSPWAAWDGSFSSSFSIPRRTKSSYT